MDLFSWDGIHIQILLLSSVYGLDIRVHMQAMVYWRWVPVDLSIAAVT